MLAESVYAKTWNDLCTSFLTDINWHSNGKLCASWVHLSRLAWPARVPSRSDEHVVSSLRWNKFYRCTFSIANYRQVYINGYEKVAWDQLLDASGSSRRKTFLQSHLRLQRPPELSQIPLPSSTPLLLIFIPTFTHLEPRTLEVLEIKVSLLVLSLLISNLSDSIIYNANGQTGLRWQEGYGDSHNHSLQSQWAKKKHLRMLPQQKSTSGSRVWVYPEDTLTQNGQSNITIAGIHDLCTGKI